MAAVSYHLGDRRELLLAVLSAKAAEVDRLRRAGHGGGRRSEDPAGGAGCGPVSAGGAAVGSRRSAVLRLALQARLTDANDPPIPPLDPPIFLVDLHDAIEGHPSRMMWPTAPVCARCVAVTMA